MKGKVFLVLLVLTVAIANIKVESKSNLEDKFSLSLCFENAEAQSEGGGPSACGVVCCDWDLPMWFPPAHVRCEIICIPQNFCIATGGSAILCDFDYMSCTEHCTDACGSEI